MLQAISDWLKQIILVVMIATLIDLLLPNQSMERYVKLVLGLVIIMVILHPIYQFFKEPFHLALPAFTIMENGENMYMGSKILANSQRIKEQQQQMIHKQSEQALAEQISKELSSQFKVQITTASIKLAGKEKNTHIDELQLTVRDNESKEEGSKADQFVQPVQITLNLQKNEQVAAIDAKHVELMRKMKQYVQEKWQVAKEQVIVEWDLGTGR